MGTVLDKLKSDFTKFVNAEGTTLRLKYYAGSVSTAEWDDAQAFTQSGADVWTSGVCLPILNIQGSSEAVLVEQGKIKTEDKRFYIQGEVSLNAPSQGSIKIGLGSPIINEHSMIPDGVENWPPISGECVYKKLYGRILGTGSFSGEY